MKFKIIFAAFNILIVFSFLLVFLLPIFMLGSDYVSLFWKDSWYIAVVFIVILLSINILYFSNRRLLSFLENENWPELKNLLEEKIFASKKIRKMYIRMYISTSIAASEIDDIRRLEAELRETNPRALKEWALPLGLPYLLSGDPVKMKSFFGEFIDSETADSGWIKWNYCFALLLLEEKDEAVSILKDLSAEKKDPLLRLSSLYMLSPFRNDENAGQILEDGRAELKTGKTRQFFIDEMKERKDNVQMLFISKIIGEALDWLYSEGLREDDENL